MIKRWVARGIWVSRSGDETALETPCGSKAEAQKVIERWGATKHEIRDAAISRELWPSNRWEEALASALKFGRPVYYWKAGGYSKGWAHRGYSQLDRYEKAAEAMGLELYGFGNDSPSGHAQAGYFCLVREKGGKEGE